ncbi:serine hydrolase [Tsukamurella pulmonis]|uniref:Beta-lactamase class A n=1 Tax=Tsukamurella pulmonis TaxID=47312 RepID=A0A1H1B7V5_9ACTN|nr:serine hydrolase [Tsukamurella pulmonis]KXO94227.1 serine hydrolase [Tsukamurella pulmonis]SDQ47980.1 beta-lactamase class A [Tsukamurella pulmonis]SUP25505.1 Beta-lactamase regulatory protein BlaB [Tsukamurella pulmonis]
MTAAARIDGVFADAGCNGWLHARVIGHPAALSVGGEQPVVPASVYKVVLLVAAARAIDAGRLDPRARVSVDPACATPGPTGIAALTDPVEMSVRDLLRSMIAVSDNAAAGELMRLVGLDAVQESARTLGLSGTRIVGGDAEIHAAMMAETDTRTVAEAFAALADDDLARPVHAYDPSFGSATTAADMTALLAAIWTDTAASPAQCAFARSALGGQVFRHRVASGFGSAPSIAGKTGTLGALRNEVSVVTYPGEHPVAVAVFTHAARNDPSLPRVDAAIGTVAAIAVDALRIPIDQER